MPASSWRTPMRPAPRFGWCFLAAISYPRRRRRPGSPRPRSRIGPLPWLFSQGWEIRTTFSELSAAVFHRSEMLRHKRVVEAYLRKHVRDTLAPKGYVRFPPSFGLEEGARGPAGRRHGHG